MTWDLSIRGKLLLITVAVLSAGAVAGAWLVVESYRESMLGAARASNEALASTIAEYGVAPLVFDDAGGAEEMLAKLKSHPDVIRVTLLDMHGRAFAGYARKDDRATSRPASATLETKHPVVHQGETFGHLVLQTSTESVDRRIAEVVQRIALGTAAIVILCALVALRLQRTITEPLSRLSSAMQRVGAEGTLGERVARGGSDEISVLFSRFNDMLEQLEQRSRERDRTQLWLRTLLASLPDDVFVFDELGRMIEALGGDQGHDALPSRAPTGLSVHDLLPEPVATQMLQGVQRTLVSGEPVRIDYELERAKDRQRYEAVLTPLGIDDDTDEGPLVLALSRNVTERRRLQEQFLRSQKLEAVGQLAGGVAHDFNNLLTGIMGYAELIQQGGDPGLPAEEILRISDRASDLVRQLLAFSRKSTARHTSTDVNELLTRVKGILSHTLDPRIRLHIQLVDEPAMVLGDASQLESAVLNLAVNARDAMPNGGTLSLTTRIVELDPVVAEATGEGLSEGMYVEVTVADTGEGIAADVVDRIFEPFFTTKEAGKGTGLGLAAVYGTATSHRGTVQVRSQSGRGSAFRMFLPMASDLASARPDPSVQPGTGRLMLVDDEESVRVTASKLLEGLGYEVEAFDSPRDAIAHFEAHQGEIDGVILDMVMPQMNGADVAQRLRQIRPDVRILVASGYLSLDEQLPDALARLPMVSKPFTLAELSDAVRGLLASPSADRGLRVV